MSRVGSEPTPRHAAAAPLPSTTPPHLHSTAFAPHLHTTHCPLRHTSTPPTALCATPPHHSLPFAPHLHTTHCLCITPPPRCLCATPRPRCLCITPRARCLCITFPPRGLLSDPPPPRDSGSNFGAYSLLLSIPHRSDVVTVGLCEFLLLPQSAYLQLQERFPDQAHLATRAAKATYKAAQRSDECVIANWKERPTKLAKLTGGFMGEVAVQPSSWTHGGAIDASSLSRMRARARGLRRRLQRLLGPSQIWNVATLTAQMYNIFLAPFRLSLDPSLSVPVAAGWAAADLVADILLGVDILVARRTPNVAQASASRDY